MTNRDTLKVENLITLPQKAEVWHVPDDALEYPENAGKKAKVKKDAPQEFHEATDEYELDLQALMQKFFESGMPATAAQLDKRLAKLKADYLTLCNSRLEQAFKIGTTLAAHSLGNEPPPNSALGRRKLNMIKATSHQYFDGLIDDLKDACLRQMRTGTKQVGYKGFMDIATGFINRIAQYSGHFWQAIHEGIGDFLSVVQDNKPQPVTRHLDPEARHCSTCPEKAGDYKSWEDMANTVGVPGDGSDECLGNCRCFVTWGVDVE